jgi:hypothetical protein
MMGLAESYFTARAGGAILGAPVVAPGGWARGRALDVGRVFPVSQRSTVHELPALRPQSRRSDRQHVPTLRPAPPDGARSRTARLWLGITGATIRASARLRRLGAAGGERWSSTIRLGTTGGGIWLWPTKLGAAQRWIELRPAGMGAARSAEPPDGEHAFLWRAAVVWRAALRAGLWHGARRGI